jgi:molybdopterin molybdotransferase
MTGAAVPDDANAVIKKEDAVQSGNVVSFTVEQCLPYQHIARKGGDVLKNGLSITKNRQINAGALSALASLGRSNIRVFRLPRVAILSTGNEITSVDVPITKHQIRDSNSFFIAGFLQHYSITPVIKKIIQDDVESLISNIEAVKDCDILILSGGVSAGDADFVPDALERCGVQALFHKVKIKPGKPIWFGHHTNGLTVFALPGNPFSVQVASNIFIEPYLRSCFHLPPVTPFRLPINVTRKKKVSIDEFFPAKYAHEGALEISPIVFNGSGDITAIVHSHGIVHHPSAANDLMQDDLVDFYPWEKFTDQ